MTQPVAHYEQLHFNEYLDGGNEKLVGLNWHVLQNGLSLYELRDPTSFIDSPKPRVATQTYPEDEDGWLRRYSPMCERILHRKAIGISYPGGAHRSSLRLHLDDGQSVIATRRMDATRAQFESLVMRRLESHGAPIPTHYAFNGLLLLQEDLPGERLADVLRKASEPEYLRALELALLSLRDIHRIADDNQLHGAVPIVGCEHEWLIALIDRTALIGHHVGIPCPPVPVRQLYTRLFLLQPRFVKWDARPGNAMLADGEVKWFDWEHCCARQPIDDLVWLLCDDACPEFPEAENALIDRWLGDFAADLDAADAYAYLRVFGVHHSCVRLARLLDAKSGDSWHTYERNVDVQPGSMLATAQRLCRRAARWSLEDKTTVSLSDWFLDIERKLPSF